ncbi:calcyclin-binding protein [Macrosteles quadrilineatus]|uniref:calcyclin-binding protein n=1 Tax=Macrosteles quadrilineatus TaxID=74068 RepID=UPI0023E23D73|nr:calcyclin-binding protein [Macrosteles quadrilineatus]
MSSKIDELKADVSELNQLLASATRQRVKDAVSLEIRKLQTEISRLQEQTGSADGYKTSQTTIPSTNRCYEVKLNNYAWDQSDKFVKIFVTLKNVHTLPADSVFTTFTANSMELHMNGLENRNYTLLIKNLLETIDTSKSSWKVKTDMVVVSLAKVNTGNTWSHLTSSEKKAKEPKPTPKPSNEGDPSSGLIDLMKQMYEDGDDDMKRTIAKAWTESRSTGGMPSF